MNPLICEHCGGQMVGPEPHYKLPGIILYRCENCGRHAYEEGNPVRQTKRTSGN